MRTVSWNQWVLGTVVNLYLGTNWVLGTVVNVCALAVVGAGVTRKTKTKQHRSAVYGSRVLVGATDPLGVNPSPGSKRPGSTRLVFCRRADSDGAGGVRGSLAARLHHGTVLAAPAPAVPRAGGDVPALQVTTLLISMRSRGNVTRDRKKRNGR
eukprot:1691780-Pyramimonas_sp.AAC.1